MVEKLSGCIEGIDGNGNIIIKPVVFLGGTVLSFNASLGVGPTQESTLSVEIINDCKIAANDNNGGLFYGALKIGSPAYFSVCEAMGKNKGDPGCFEFGGIVTNVSIEQSSSGEIYKLTMVDPRSLLENFTIVVGNNLSGPIKHRNYFNAFAYYEHNALSEPFKYKNPNQDVMLLPKSPGDDDPIIPPGDNTKADCSVFGDADSNDRGMSYRKILEALKADNNGDGPMVYSPNYGEPYNPQVQPPFNQFLNNRNLHEGNVFRLDLSDMPDPPQYYRVAGPSISLLQLITEVCDVLGREFIVTLERGVAANDEPYVIKVKTKKIAPIPNNVNVLSQIIPYQGATTNLTYGKELRIDKSRHILLGDQRHDIYQSALIEFYFGEDSDGNPIVPRTVDNGCGFEIDIEIKDLNVLLNCPLFDTDNTLLERKVTITEADIRAALASLQLWKGRIGSTTIPGDFNAVLRHNYPNLESNLISKAFDSLAQAADATAVALGLRAAADAASVANSSMVATLAHNQAKDLEAIHAFIVNIGKTYYGKQYLVTLDGEMCIKPAGLSLETKDPDGAAPDGKVVAIDPNYECETEKDIMIGLFEVDKIMKERVYSHIPTNAGGWWDRCETLLGLGDEGAKFLGDFYPGVSLSFFRGEEDPRVQPFARFDSSDVKIKFTSSFGHKEPDPNNPGQVVQVVDIIDYTEVGEFIEATCGALDASLFDPNDYLAIRKNGGVCIPPVKKEVNEDQPVPGLLVNETRELIEEPKTIWIKCQVEEKLYIHEDKPKVVIQFNAPCLKKVCGDQGLWHEAFMFLAEALAATSGTIAPPEDAEPPPEEEDAEKPVDILKSTRVICGIPIFSGLVQTQSAIDASAINSKGFFPTAEKPSAVAIPVRNNLLTYGPWYSTNFKTNAGGVNLTQDNDLSPWVFGSTRNMNNVAANLLKEAETPLSESETGTIDYPYWPELNLGFLENGPNLTNINVTFGGNGINTNYNFQTYTTKFGKLNHLESQQLKDTNKNKQKLTKLIQARNIEKHKIDRKLKKFNPVRMDLPETRSGLRNAASLQRVMCGETYDFKTISTNEFNQRTAVGTDTLEKSMLELRYDYDKKAYISLDGLYSPVAINSISISGHHLPGFISPYSGSFIGYSDGDTTYYSYDSGVLNIDKLSNSISPQPPFIYATNGCDSGVSNVRIHNKYLNPLANPDAIPYTSGDEHLGHSIDIVGRGKNVPESGLINSLYDINDQSKYSDNYRFLGMRGPVVLHSWGYDTEGKPIPNAIDDEKLAQSGIFTIKQEDSEGGHISGLKDEFLKDWLQKPASWPVGPIDLRFDRERGVWVSPQPYRIVVAKLDELLEAYGEAEATIIIQDDNSNQYHKTLYDKNGQIVEENEAKIQIVDRIGNSYKQNSKVYCYYDSYSSKYIILAGAEPKPGVVRGTFVGSWAKLQKKTVSLAGGGEATCYNFTVDILYSEVARTCFMMPYDGQPVLTIGSVYAIEPDPAEYILIICEAIR